MKLLVYLKLKAEGVPTEISDPMCNSFKTDLGPYCAGRQTEIRVPERLNFAVFSNSCWLRALILA